MVTAPNRKLAGAGGEMTRVKAGATVNIPTVVGEVELSAGRVKEKLAMYTHPASPVLAYMGFEMLLNPKQEHKENYIRLTVGVRDTWSSSPGSERIIQNRLFQGLIGPDTKEFQVGTLGKLLLPYHLIYDGAPHLIPKYAEPSGVEIDIEQLVRFLISRIHRRVIPTPGGH
ncbi:hypothetical protein BV898_04021 [Hypsibius exemplaris]|uniref:Uncharacterized protein n=1 Tax=Hypsibius exemplaris TaxID=2072580 RepID=A0A1W0X4C5_HYPEX|nr:hypothetical protein BV898_04021 [Hypsibius exemplaris]